MQWRQMIGVAVLCGATAVSAPLVAQTQPSPTALPAAQPGDTSWAAERDRISQDIERGLRELVADTPVAPRQGHRQSTEHRAPIHGVFTDSLQHLELALTGEITLQQRGKGTHVILILQDQPQ